MDIGTWFALLGQTSALAVATAVVAGALFGAAVARWATFPVWIGVLFGVFVPVVGPITAAVVARTNRTAAASGPAVDGYAPPRVRRVRRPVDLIVAGGALVITAVALLVPWFEVRLGEGMPRLTLFAWGRVLDVLLITSIVFLAVGLALIFFVAHRFAAIVVLIPVAAFWAFTGVAFVLLSAPLETLLRAIGGIQLTIGAVLSWLGVATDGATLTLPDGIDPSLLGLEGRTVDVSGIDLAAVIPTVGMGIGTGWYLMLGVAAVILVWAVAVLVTPSASRPDSRAGDSPLRTTPPPLRETAPPEQSSDDLLWVQPPIDRQPSTSGDGDARRATGSGSESLWDDDAAR